VVFQERSYGPLYLCSVRPRTRWVPPHIVGIVEMEEPWRKGHAVVVPVAPRSGVAIGLWWRPRRRDVSEEFRADYWLRPRWMETESTEIGQWGDSRETKIPPTAVEH